MSILKEFNRGAVHMAIVCSDPQAAGEEHDLFVKKLRQEFKCPESSISGSKNTVDFVADYERHLENDGPDVTGIITMENVVEYMMGLQIKDEKDL